MLENNLDVVYDHPSKTFIGVRFVLFGFDVVKKDQILSKLLEGGGTDVGRYGPDCTHVIVDQIVYDDPRCVMARNDGKAVVTSLWVDHSCDVAMPVDTTSIMYQPLRDLNGIPGAKSLIVCLTGYQRQDRDDIMTMVGLMGAKFSKPLVANRVTHLVCYKFEGEKYELAKKLKRIRVVNHRWLEDCLRAWEILPEADYNKSGYELEMMDAEAKDSDEETNEMVAKQYGDQKIFGPRDLKIEMKNPHEPFLFEQEKSRNNNNSSAFKPLSDPENTNEMLSTTRKEEKSDAASWPQEIHSGTFDLPSIPDARTLRECPGLASNPFDKALSPEKVGSVSTSGAKTAKMLLHSDVSNLSPLNYLSRSTKKASLPISSHQKESNIVSNLTVDKQKLQVGDGISISPSSLGPDETASSGAKFSCSPKLSHPGEAQNSTLAEKRKMTMSCYSPKSEKKSRNVKMVSGDVFTSNKMEGLVLSSGEHGSRGISNLFSPSGAADCMDRNEVAGPPQKFSDDLSKTVTPETKQESNVQALQTSSRELEKGCSASKADNMEANGHSTPEGVVSTERDETTQLSGTKMTGIQKSSGLAELGLPKEGDANSQQKPLKKKMLARKSLGSTSRFSKANPINKRGSVEPNRTVYHIDSATNTLGRNDAEEHKKLLKSARVDLLHPTGSMDDKNSNDTNNSVEAQRSFHKVGFADDDTEAPEDGEGDFYVAMREKNADAVEASHSVDVLPAKELSAPGGAEQNVSHILDDDQEVMTSGVENSKSEADGAVCDNKLEPNESTSLDNTAAERLTKGNKRPLTKTKKNNLPHVTKVASSEEDTQRKESKPEKSNVNKEVKKERISSKASLKTKMSAPLKKSKSSLEVEKENRPLSFGDKNASNYEENDKKVMSKLKKKPVADSKDTKDATPDIRNEPVWFVLSGHRFQRKEFQQVIRRLKGRVCRDSHQWSYQATHLIVPDPIRRTEKIFAAAASGRWILKTDYLTASNEAGRFLPEQPYEWHKNGLSQDGAISLEAPRKWRLLRERTGHGAFYGMRIVVYGECIAPPLDTLKRAVKAGDGTILATSPPYTRFLQSGIEFAIVSPGIPRADMWVQEFLRHEIPCVLADYLVEYVCKPGYSLDKHVQYGTHAWADKSLNSLMNLSEETIHDLSPAQEDSDSDMPCQVCGSRERGEVMLICGDESGSSGCGIGTHIDCCDPPLDEVPAADWFCPKCTEIKARTNDPPSSKKAKPKLPRKK